MTVQFAIGDLVRITRKPQGNANTFNVGEVVRVTRAPLGNDNYYTCEYLDGHDWWYVQEDEMEAHMEESSTGEVDNSVTQDQRREAFDWANQQIPKGDLDIQVKLANWLLTGVYQ